MPSPSRITSEVDFDAEGIHQGFLRLPHSVHRSAYGWIPIPVVSVRAGHGPTVLLLAGVHGDEFEGQVALSKLGRWLKPVMIQGQVIILPMANFPAARSGMRTSPLDDGNLNRLFPGDADGTPTSVIAHFIESELMPRADYLLDIHSGGSSLRYETTLLMAEHPDAEHQGKGLALLDCFGFSRAILFPESTHGTYSSSAARRNGVVGITAEVAGGGDVNAPALKTLEQGLRRFLGETGVLKPEFVPPFKPAPVELMRLESGESYVHATEEGLFEPAAEIGDRLSTGQICGHIHHPETPWREPHDVVSEMDGVVVCMRVPAQVQRGDCLFELAIPFDDRQ